MCFGEVAVQIRDNDSTENLTKLLWNNTHNFHVARKKISQGPHHTRTKQTEKMKRILRQNKGQSRLSDGSIDHTLFNVQPKKITFIWRHHHWRWRAAIFKLIVGTYYGFWEGRALYCATPTVTFGLWFMWSSQIDGQWSDIQTRHTGQTHRRT